MNQYPLVHIIILNWNGWRDTLACVESCRKLSWPTFRIVIVDNGSTDGSVAILRKQLHDIQIIQSGGNLGFAGGNNIGIRQALNAGADFVWLLNNDTEVASDALTRLVEALEDGPRVGCVSSKIYLHYDPQRLDFAGGLWDKGRLRKSMWGAGQLDRGQFDEPLERGSVSGCSMLVSARAIRDVGLMDESYFLYWEDTEWCARLRKKGYSIYFVPTSHVWHKVSASAGKNSFSQHYYFIRNGFFFLKSHDPLLLPFFALNNLLFAVKCLMTGAAGPLKGLMCGFIDFLRGVRGPMMRG